MGYRVGYGGKGSNQAVGCARLGAKVTFIAKIGRDAFGEMALGLCRDEGVGYESALVLSPSSQRVLPTCGRLVNRAGTVTPQHEPGCGRGREPGKRRCQARH